MVPWTDFKAPPGIGLLVLDTTNNAMEAAPRVNHDQFTTGGHSDQVSHEVDGTGRRISRMGPTGTPTTHPARPVRMAHPIWCRIIVQLW